MNINGDIRTNPYSGYVVVDLPEQAGSSSVVAAERSLPHRPVQGSVSDRPLDSREILAAGTPSQPLIELEQPEIALPEISVSQFEVKSPKTNKSGKFKKPFKWLKVLAADICRTLFHRSHGRSVDKHSLNLAVQDLPAACTQVVISDTELLSELVASAEKKARLQPEDEEFIPKTIDKKDWQELKEAFESYEPPVKKPEPQDEDEIFYDAREHLESEPPITKAQKTAVDGAEKIQQSAEGLPREEKPTEVVYDFLTGMPVDELAGKARTGVARLGHLLSPAGRVLRGFAEKCLSKQSLKKLECALKDGIEGRVDYEVKENTGRRLAQLMSVAGASTPLIPLMLWLHRAKDFKEELTALYKDRNVAPLAMDLTATFGPAALGMAVTMLAASQGAVM